MGCRMGWCNTSVWEMPHCGTPPDPAASCSSPPTCSHTASRRPVPVQRRPRALTTTLPPWNLVTPQTSKAPPRDPLTRLIQNPTLQAKCNCLQAVAAMAPTATAGDPQACGGGGGVLEYPGSPIATVVGASHGHMVLVMALALPRVTSARQFPHHASESPICNLKTSCGTRVAGDQDKEPMPATLSSPDHLERHPPLTPRISCLTVCIRQMPLGPGS